MRFATFLVSTILCITNFTFAQATQPSGASGYAEESYRLVAEKDEIVAVLKNGATVIAKRVPSPAVSVRGYVQTGGIYEGQWLGGGLSHLLEHLVAGGSTKNRTEEQNRTMLQEIGNDSNAMTSYDVTTYFINTTPAHLDKAVDLLTGWLLGALITPDEYGREYEVVQRELEMGKGEPDRQFYYLSTMNRYRVHPIRVPVIGYQEVIQGLSRDDVYSYYKLTYQPNNMVFSIAGDIDPEEVVKTVRKYLDGAPAGRVPSHDLENEPAVQGPRTVVATAPKIGQAKLQLAFPSIKLDHPDLYALDLLSNVLSSGESSILIEEIRDKKQLVSSIDSGDWTPNFADGTFAISMQLDPDKIADATTAVLDLLEQIKQNGVSEERVERAKTQVKAAHVRSKQTSQAIASDLAGNYLSTGDPHFEDRYVERMDAVPASAMKEMARKYFDRNVLITTAMIPEEFVGAAGMPKASDLLRATAPAVASKDQKESTSKVERIVLSNGTIVLLKRVATAPIVAIQLYSLGGLTSEDEKTNGIGNLTMELAPRGTKSRTAQQIAEFFDSTGGGIGTTCGNNTWYWSATCLKEQFDKTMEVTSDVVLNASFPDSEVTLMKQRILAAIEQQDADWSGQAMRYFRKMYYGPKNLPYQFIAIGSKEVVSPLTSEQLKKWYQEKILPSRRVLAIYGDIDIEHAKAMAEKHFGTLPKAGEGDLAGVSGEAARSQSTGAKAGIEIERVEVQATKQPLAGVVIGFDADTVIGDPANYAVAVADTLTSGYTYPTGYLHETLRGRGLVYVVHAMTMPGRTSKLPGAYIVYAGCDPRRVNEVVDLALQETARVQGDAKAIDANWFNRAKQLITTTDAMENETASEQAQTAALDEIYGLGYDFHEHFADKINAVKLEDVQNIARQKIAKCVVTISTPLPNLVKVEKGVRTYESFPPIDLTPKGVAHGEPGGGQ